MDKIDAHGRFLEQVEEECEVTQSKKINEEQWQLSRGKSTSKKSMRGRSENEINIDNAFKVLVDTT